MLKFNAFVKNKNGSVIILFAFFFLVIMMAVSMVVDGAKAFNAKSKSSYALDAAILAAAKALNETEANDAELTDIANRTFSANIYGIIADARFETVSLSINRETNTVSGRVNGAVETSFASVVNITTIPISNESSTIFNTRDIELAMMLDVTGSMQHQNRIDDLKVAAKDVVDILIGSGPASNKTRIGLAPYAAAVNVGSFASRISNNTSLDNCVVERAVATSRDDAPNGNKSFQSFQNAIQNIRDQYGSNRISEYNRRYQCPTSEIVPLTNNAALLKSEIDQFQPAGFTAGHVGVTWAWNIISPLWRNVWPSDSAPDDYNQNDVIKAVILMTDGMFNTAFIGSPEDGLRGDYDGSPTSKDITEQLCNNMKSENVVIYSVSFQAPTRAQQTLRNCATQADNYFDAQNGAELRDAFRSIAIRLARVRLSQ